MSSVQRDLPPIICPVSGCGKQVKTYRGLGLHSASRHGLCVNCVLRGANECDCRAKRLAEQVDHGVYVRVIMTGNRSLTMEDLHGDPERPNNFIWGYEVDHRGHPLLKQTFIHTGMVKRIVSLSYNIHTGELEPTLPENLSAPTCRSS